MKAEGSYFIPMEKLAGFMQEGAMNGQEGVALHAIADPKIADLIPPPLELVDPDNPVVYLYIVNITKPTFAPWYMEGGIGVITRYKEYTGVYFFNLQLSGPGALMGAFSGRESAGLPKKLADRIVVERIDDFAHCYIDRNGVRLAEVELKMGSYNDPDFHVEQEGSREDNPVETQGGCLLHRYRFSGTSITDMEIIYYDSPTRFVSWEPAHATLTLNSSIDDPWGDIKIDSILGAAWMKSDNYVVGVSTVDTYPDEEIPKTLQYLYSGRYDRSLICTEHQIYG